jgi:diamine N-acetyltransferase
MEKLEITEIGNIDLAELATLAKRIWTEHYTPIIGAEQVAYMVEKFQSEQAIAAQIQSGYRYYFFRYDREVAGYMGIEVKDGALFLSKLYVDKAFRGKKISRAALNFLSELCRKEGLSRIWLTVNKRNSNSIAAYQALGFSTVRSQVADIGHGFVMDDYVLQRRVAAGNDPSDGVAIEIG